MYLVFIRLQPPFPCVVKQEIKINDIEIKKQQKKLWKKLASVALSNFFPFEKQINEW